MIDILHQPIYMYIYMYCTTRIPMLWVYKVYLRSCRISIINSSTVLRELALEAAAEPIHDRLSNPTRVGPNRPHKHEDLPKNESWYPPYNRSWNQNVRYFIVHGVFTAPKHSSPRPCCQYYSSIFLTTGLGTKM